MPAELEALRAVLESQYRASLAMLRQGVELCPEESWASDEHTNAPWQIAYHTLFFTHLYLGPTDSAFRPWPRHRADCQHPDGIAGPSDPKSDLPLLPEPYTKAEVVEYLDQCDEMLHDAVGALDLGAPESGFHWYPVSKLEHQLINLRHLQHGAAQLADRVRAAADAGVKWVGARPPR